MDFYISMGLAVLFQILKSRKDMVKYKSAMRKAYFILNANRDLFLAPEDTEELVKEELRLK